MKNLTVVKKSIKKTGLFLLWYFILMTGLAVLTMKNIAGEQWIESGCILSAGILAAVGTSSAIIKEQTVQEALIPPAGFYAAVILLGFLMTDTLEIKRATCLLFALLLGIAAALIVCRGKGPGGKKNRKQHYRK